MPSGAKKRKAARKKKETDAHLNGSTNFPEGTDNYEVKSQDDKDSEVGDVNSPPSQDKEQHDNPFSRGTELVQEKDTSAISSLPSENNSNWREVINGLSKEELMKKAESVNVSKDRNGERSTVRLVNWTGMSENSQQEEYFNPVMGPVAHDDLVTPDSSSDKVAVSDIPVQREVSVISECPTLSADKPVAELSELSGQVTEHSPVEKPVTNVENVTPAAGTDLTFQIVDDKAYPPTNVDVKASCGVEKKPKRYDSEELPSAHLPVTSPNNTVEYVKDSGIPECSENQLLVASAPRVVEKTSWLSCCGLFEVLSGMSGSNK